MFLILLAATAAGFLTMAATASISMILALVVSPLVGSAAGLGAALFLAWRRGPEWLSDSDLEQRTDAMVGALRALAEQGRTGDCAPTIQATRTSQAA